MWGTLWRWETDILPGESTPSEHGPICHLAHSASCFGSLSVFFPVSLFSTTDFSILSAAARSAGSIPVQFSEIQTGWRSFICAFQFSASRGSSRQCASQSATCFRKGFYRLFFALCSIFVFVFINLWLCTGLSHDLSLICEAFGSMNFCMSV